MDRGRAGRREGGFHYRITVDGDLPQEWAGWFGVDTLHTLEGRSILQVRVADQAQLHGVLRRVHDVHLTLRSVRLLDVAPDAVRGTPHDESEEGTHEDDRTPGV